MRADRLLSIIWLLRAHEKLSTGELADLLEVSRRTIMRDIDALSAAGVPVYSERGPHGGIRLLPGYRTDVTALSSEESRALFAGVTAWGAESLGLGDALASGLRKLLAAVPDGNRQSTADVSSRIVVDPQGWMPQTAAEQTGTIFSNRPKCRLCPTAPSHQIPPQDQRSNQTDNCPTARASERRQKLVPVLFDRR